MAKLLLLILKNCFTYLKASCPDVYRGKFNRFNRTGEDLCGLYIDELHEIIKSVRQSGKGVAAYISESLQSCGGQVIPPEGYFEKVYK